VQVTAQDDGEAGGAAGRPPDDRGILGPMEMQVPRLAVVTVEPGVRPGHREQSVQEVSGQVDVAGGDSGEHGPECLRELGELGGFSLGKIVGFRMDGPQCRSGRGGQARPVGRDVAMPPGLTRGERVDEADRHRHHGIHVTVEVHLTSYVLAF